MDVSQPGWRRPRRLSHLDAARATYAVTFRLADSLPPKVMTELDRRIDALGTDRWVRYRRRWLQDLLDDGAGSCLLRRVGPAAAVQEALLRRHGRSYELHAWVRTTSTR